MNDVLFHSELAEREHGTDLLSVPELIQWAEGLGGQLRTEPDFRGFACVQIEALLCAIGAPFDALTLDEARTLVAANPELATHRAADVAPKWLLSADAQRQWRKTIDDAIEAGDLIPLDFQSRLPKRPAKRESEPETAEIPRSMLADPEQLIQAFGSFTGMDASWFRNLKDKPGLLRARRSKGTRGTGGASPLFCPYAVMTWLTDTKTKRKVGRTLGEHKGWELLERHFSRVYSQYSGLGPQEPPLPG